MALMHTRRFETGRYARASVVVLAILATGCRSDSETSAAGDTRANEQRYPGSAAVIGDVLDADRRFSRDVAEGGLDAWVAAFAEDGAMIPATGPIAAGPAAIRELMAPAFQSPDFTLVWEPQGGEVSASGDLAYTYGEYESRDASGELSRGRYVTVWRRGDDGVWRVVADIGNREPGPRGPDG